MRVGIISDIHNNVVALNAVIDRLNQEGCERIICCGDIIGIGPYPEETLQRFMDTPNIIAIRGNHERYLLEGLPNQVPNEDNMVCEEIKQHKWEHSLLSDRSRKFLEGLFYRADIKLGGLDIAVAHYGMNGSGRYIPILPNPTFENCREMFKDIDADIILYGHDHRTTVNQGEHRLYANPGSLGCPAKDGNIARAGILNISNKEAVFEPIKVPYNVDKVLADIDRLAYPASEVVKIFFYGKNKTSSP